MQGNDQAVAARNDARRAVVALDDPPTPENIHARMTLLALVAAGEGLDVPLDVTMYIAAHTGLRFRELPGALVRVTTSAAIRNEVVTLESAQEALGDVEDVLSPHSDSVIPQLADGGIEVPSRSYNGYAEAYIDGKIGELVRNRAGGAQRRSSEVPEKPISLIPDLPKPPKSPGEVAGMVRNLRYATEDISKLSLEQIEASANELINHYYPEEGNERSAARALGDLAVQVTYGDVIDARVQATVDQLRSSNIGWTDIARAIDVNPATAKRRYDEHHRAKSHEYDRERRSGDE